MISTRDIIPMLTGHIVLREKPDDPLHGQPLVLVAYLIRHPDALLLFDTGIARLDPDNEATIAPWRRPLDEALAGAGARVDQVQLVANCHLHFDHSGNNDRFAGLPIFAQRVEHAAALQPDYTMPQVADFPGAAFELLDGEAEILPGVRIIPTPGHTPGHQALVIETREGRVVLAGQTFNTTSEYAAAEYAWRLAQQGRDEGFRIPVWLPSVVALDPVEVRFAHDVAVWHAPRTGMF
jgi:glyoxylase-like metal-dependent hydrolase (beta-lactamase superfamily II)